MRGIRAFFILASLCMAIFSPTSGAQDNEPAWGSARNKVTSERLTPEGLDKKYNLKWKLLSGGRYYTETLSDMKAATLGFFSEFGWRFTDSLDLKTRLSLVMNTERSQLQFGDAEFEHGIRLREAVLRYRPATFLEIGAGAVNQGFLHSPLLIDRSNAYPGAYAALCFCQGSESPTNFVSLKAQYSIPTSRSLNSQRIEKEPSPSFTTQTLMAHLEVNKHLEIEPFYTLFQYTDLPTRVAFESVSNGNSVTGVLPTQTRFDYEFSGYVAGAETKLTIVPNFKLLLGYSMIENQEAPEAFNTGQILGGGFELELADVIIRPIAQVFYNESDTSPAFYNNANYGNNNRQGYGVKLDIEFPKQGFAVVTEYMDLDLINPSPHQYHGQMIQFKLETTYAEI